jgi:hypothetical protein
MLRFSHLVSIWWLRTWRGALGGIIAVTPFALGFYLLDRAHIRAMPLRLAEQTLVVVIGGAVAWCISRMALAKRYRHFRIALLPHGADGPELSVTNRHVLAFWWLLVWRAGLGAAVISLIAEWGERALPGMARIIEVIAVLAILGWEFAVLRMALMKRYRDFRIVVQPHR